MRRPASPRLALGLLFTALSCSTPSSSVDGGDLLGVFEPRDAGSGPDASLDAGSKARSRRDAGAARADATGPLGSASPLAPTAGASATGPAARAPIEGSCVAEEGIPNREIRRVIGRPPCRDAQVLEWRDGEGSPRYACVIAPKNVETRAPLPLVVFFHAPYEDPTSVDKKTGLRKLGSKLQLSDDAAHAGFIILAPQGRHIRGGKQGAIFDADYTGQDSVDVATVDHFIEELSAKKLVDKRRVYTLGASFGGQMASTYAMMRADKVAAFAVYASDSPRAAWTCPGPPPPAMVAYRACDQFFPCESVERWLRARDALSAETGWIRLGDFMNDEPNCAFAKKCSATKGGANHRKWPKAREEEILRFLGRHTLSISP